MCWIRGAANLLALQALRFSGEWPDRWGWSLPNTNSRRPPPAPLHGITSRLDMRAKTVSARSGKMSQGNR